MKSRIAILLAAERSGTHFFRSIINGNNAGFSYWEVANAEIQPGNEDQLNIFSFRKSLEPQGIDLSRSTVEQTTKIINLYLDHCIEFGNSRTAPLIIDIKYGHLINFHNGWWDFYSPPLLFKIANEREIPFIHLRRENLYRAALSDLYASQTNLWKITETADVTRPAVQISREELETKKQAIETMVSTVRRWLQDSISCEILYEELEDPNSNSWRNLSALLAREVTETKSEFKRVITDYQAQIQNYSEISDLIG